MEEAEKLSHLKIILIGGSAGSLTVLLAALPDISPYFPLPIVIVTHRHSGPDNLLELLLRTRTTLLVKELEEKEVLCAGTIYLAPPDYHLLFERDGTVSLDDSEKVNYSRPSIDVSFESAAEAYQSRLIAILLSGANADGAKGMQTIQLNGGTTIIQDPKDAEIDYMPTHALQMIKPDYVITAAQLGPLINRLSQ